VEHIIVGVLLLTPLVVLLPTTLAHVLFIAAIHTSLQVAGLRLLRYLWRGVYALRPYTSAKGASTPRLFQREFSLEAMPSWSAECSGVGISHFRLRPSGGI